jgi:tetratricopeptide (TPR) repeat protein
MKVEVTNEYAAAERQEWIDIAGRELPVEPETMFPETHGLGVQRSNTRRANLLSNLKSVLLKALETNERCRYVARARRYSTFEGHLGAHLGNQMALVLTNRRLLLIQVNAKGLPGDIKNQIRLEEICKVKKKSGLSFYLELRLADGKHLLFSSLKQEDVRALTGAIIEQAPVEQAQGPSLEHLCPACLRVVDGIAGNVALCPSIDCQIPFRSARRAARLSLLLPGLGHIYLRHHYIGTLEYLGSLVLSGVALFTVMVAVFAPTSEQITAASIMAGGLLVLPRIFDYFMTRHAARKGLVPLDPGFDTAFPSEAFGPSPKRYRPFPRWAYGLFVGSILAFVFLLNGLVPFAKAEAVMELACEDARQSRFDDALSKWQEAENSGLVGNEDRARLALHLFEAGDIEDGGQVLERIGQQPVEEDMANAINGSIERVQQADADYNEFMQSVFEGNEDAGLPALDRALAVYKEIKRPAVPKNRDAAFADAATCVSAAPLYQGDYETAKRLLKKIGRSAPADVLAVVQARILAAEGDMEQAIDLLSQLDPTELQPSSQILALETRCQMAMETNVGALPQIAEEAMQILPQQLSEYDRARRATLIALRGDCTEVDPEIIGLALQIAQDEGWEDAAHHLSRVVQTESPATPTIP